jgi:uncharacterized protein YukE
MAEGFEVAASDLRSFASAIEDAGDATCSLASRVDGASLDYYTPLVGLGFKSTYSGTQATAKSAITAIGEAWSAAGKLLRQIADDYEEKERAAAKALKPNP